jgi:hypothetical protein
MGKKIKQRAKLDKNGQALGIFEQNCVHLYIFSFKHP